MTVADGRREAWIDGTLERFERPLVGYASRLLGDRDRARDAVQETFLRLVQAGPAQAAAMNGRMAPWLYTVCRRVCVDVLRKEGRMLVADVELLDRREGRAADPATTAEAGDQRSQLLAAVAALPANQREVVELRFRHGLSYAEIAGVTGLSSTNVGFLLHVGIQRLRARLGATATGGDR